MISSTMTRLLAPTPRQKPDIEDLLKDYHDGDADVDFEDRAPSKANNGSSQ